MSDARNLGETALRGVRGQPSAEIVRVGCAKPRRNCVTRCAWSTFCGDRACRMCEMYAVPLGHWNALIFVFADVSYETLILGGLFLSFCECLVRNGHFGRSPLSVLANVSYKTLILGGLFVSFCECLVRNAHFGRSLCQFLRMSRTKRSFWKVSYTVFANVSYETLILEVFLVRFCECLVRNAHFGRSLCQFLRMSRTKRSFWKVSLSVFANVSYETLILEGLFVSFCECLVRNAHFGRSLCQFLRMSRTKRSFWKISLSFFANVSYETLILEDFLDAFKGGGPLVGQNMIKMKLSSKELDKELSKLQYRTKRSFWKVSLSVCST